MSEADLELNEKYKREEELSKLNSKDNGKDEESGDEELGGGDEEDLGGEEPETNSEEPETGGEEDNGGAGDIDDEMLGDVQPESTETTQA